MPSPSRALGSVIIRQSHRQDLATLRDLKHKTLAVVSTDAFGGFQIAWKELLDAEIRPFKNMHVLQTGFPMEAVVDAVRAGSADAGVLRTCLLEELIEQGRVTESEFTLIAPRAAAGYPCALSTALYPDWPFARLAHTPRALVKPVTAALLNMKSVGGHSWTAPVDYTKVHELFRTLGIAPYSHHKPSLMEVAREYWHWLAIAGIGVLWWVIHATRVEALVRRRTAELTREIRERERAEQAAQRLRAERDQFSRLGIVGEMASNIAHELNQPLAAITNYANGMRRLLNSGAPNPALLEAGANAVVDQSERAAAIVQRVRGLVRRREAARAPMDLNGLVADTLAQFDSMGGPKGVPIHVAAAAPLPEVIVDPTEIQQVLLNLLQNAVDASGTLPGESGDAGEIMVSTRADENAVTVAVHDQGYGLPPEQLERLFQPFFTTKPEGLGLGLAICRTIVESHGGRLWATPNPDRGLTVGFSLPVEDDQAGDVAHFDI
jgi:two-component system sensor histidine kinase TtrS